MSRIHYKNYKGISLLARNLRNNPTPSETALWEVLRRKNLFGFKFIRQHPIFYRIDKQWVEFFIADFFCSRLKLIVEVDGIIHEGHEEYDSERDAKLLSKGIKVLRIKNEELIEIVSIVQILKDEVNLRYKQLFDNKQDISPSLRLKGRGRGKG
ncbi:MAG: DUF559 domain-containing protein [Bacteroidia bacterium]|nr:DUF559 domain-containing protein [Bacteroidia bacterium]